MNLYLFFFVCVYFRAQIFETCERKKLYTFCERKKLYTLSELVIQLFTETFRCHKRILVTIFI